MHQMLQLLLQNRNINVWENNLAVENFLQRYAYLHVQYCPTGLGSTDEDYISVLVRNIPRKVVMNYSRLNAKIMSRLHRNLLVVIKLY